jgi:hypothetical protein
MTSHNFSLFSLISFRLAGGFAWPEKCGKIYGKVAGNFPNEFAIFPKFPRFLEFDVVGDY